MKEEKKPKFQIGEKVYYIDYVIRYGDITKIEVIKDRGFWELRETEEYIYTVNRNEFNEYNIYSTPGEAFRVMCNGLGIDKEKMDFVCSYLFPDEVTEDDFNTVAPEPLQIPEKTGFFKNLFK